MPDMHLPPGRCHCFITSIYLHSVTACFRMLIILRSHSGLFSHFLNRVFSLCMNRRLVCGKY